MAGSVEPEWGPSQACSVHLGLAPGLHYEERRQDWIRVLQLEQVGQELPGSSVVSFALEEVVTMTQLLDDLQEFRRMMIRSHRMAKRT